MYLKFNTYLCVFLCSTVHEENTGQNNRVYRLTTSSHIAMHGLPRTMADEGLVVRETQMQEHIDLMGRTEPSHLSILP